jgi:3D (Asp-Asp-Asp) domain-containing protein
MKNRKMSLASSLSAALLVSVHNLPQLRNNRILWRSLTLAALLLMMFATALANQYVQPQLLDIERIPAQVSLESPEGQRTLITYQPHLLDAIDEAGIAIGDNDLLSLPDDQPLEPGQRYDLSITRRETFTLLWSGLAVEAVSEPLSEIDLISRSGYSEIDLSDGSRVEVLESDTLAYIAVDKRTFRISEAIPYSKTTVDDPNLEVGKTKRVTQGVEGNRDLIFEDTYENGVFLNRTQIGTEITREPVQEVVSRGTKVVIKPIDTRRVGSTVLSSFESIKPLLIKNGRLNYESFNDNGDGTITVDGKTFSYLSSSTRRTTMYDGLEVCIHSGCHNPPRNHNTSSGIPAQRGLVATGFKRVDGKIYPNLPMGTIVFVEGYGLGVVADLHGISSNQELIDLSYDPGETVNGSITLWTGNRKTYILSMPK